MIRLIFNDAITPDSASKLRDDIIDIVSNFQDVTIKIYFTSNGGDCVAGEVIWATLEDFKDFIILVAGHYLGSMGWEIFYRYSGKKEMTPYFSHALLHYPSTELDTRALHDTKSEEFTKSKHIERLRQLFISSATDYITKDELKDYSEGRNIVLPRERVAKICKIKDVQK